MCFIIFCVPQVLHNVVVCSESTELISLALTAVQCMTDVVVSTEEKEIKYSTEKEVKEEVREVCTHSCIVFVVPIYYRVRWS